MRLLNLLVLLPLFSAVSPSEPPTTPEEELVPLPDAPWGPLPRGFVEVRNPAFPSPVKLPLVPSKKKRPYGFTDLTAYFASGKLAEAKTGYDEGRFEKSLALLQDQGNTLPVRYLRALLELKTLKYAEAAASMTQLAVDYPAMKDRCLTHAALAHEGLSHWNTAAALYAQIPATSHLYPDARFGLARMRHRAGDLKAAEKALEPVAVVTGITWGRDAAAEALLAQADLARERKDREAEHTALLRLDATHPLSNMAKLAQRRLRGVKAPAEVQVLRAETLIDLHRNKQGMKLLEPLLSKPALPDELACRIHFAYGKAERKERAHTRAVAMLKPVVAQCKSPDLRARALYVLGSSESIIDFSQGAATYETLARDFPAHPFADDALFYAADLYEKNGDVAKALARLEDLTTRYPGGDFYAEALFKSFWIHRRLNGKSQALAILDKIEKGLATADESYDVERERYWRARLVETEGRKDEAVELLARLALEHPSTYYGLTARTRLKTLDPKRGETVLASVAKLPAPLSPFPLDAGGMADDPHLLAGVELLRMGFGDAAASELLGVSRIGQSPEALRLLVELLAQSGDARSAHAVARASLRRDLSGAIRPETRSLWELAYPNAFRPLIETYCKRSHVDPDLLQALMREESALDPKVLSWAGALGLTQLMLPTARSMARELKIRRPVTVDALLKPDLNIELGAAYLGKLVTRFQGNFDYALGGYNAGAVTVDHWREARPGLELDEWVEEIPIAETRGYIKRVLRSYNTYQMLNGHLLPPAPPPPPSAEKLERAGTSNFASVPLAP